MTSVPLEVDLYLAIWYQTSLNYLPKGWGNRYCSKLNMDPQDRRKYNLVQETVLVRVVTSKSRGGPRQV